MNRPTWEDVTVSTRGVEVRKSLDTTQFQHPVVFLRLRSERDEPVQVRVTDSLPEPISIDDVEVHRTTATGVWDLEPGTVTFTGAVPPGEERTGLYRVTDEAIARQPLTEPELDIRIDRWWPSQRLKQLKPLAIYVVSGLLLLSAMRMVLGHLLSASPVFAGVVLLFLLLLLLLTAVGMWKTFVKAGQPGWKAIIPIYNVFILLRITGRPWWWVLGFFLPLLREILWVKVCVDLSRAFGRGLLFGVGLALGPFVFWPILGFGEDEHGRRSPRTDPERLIQAVEWRGNLENPEVAEATVEALESESPDSLTAHKLRYAIEAAEAYTNHGAQDIDLDEVRESLISTWELKTGADWETMKAA